jgi:PhzF family phenazine biosynthesis protein
MPTLPFYQVDAFTDRPLAGNPAAVMPLDAWLPDAMLQAIAAEHNLAETAFFVAEGDAFAIRWFTPLCEVPLCGHATLASAHVVFEHRGQGGAVVTFRTRERGDLTVRRGAGRRLIMDFPAGKVRPSLIPEDLHRVLGARPLEVVKVDDDDLLVVLDGPQAVRALTPAVSAFPRVKARGIIVTAEAAAEAEEDIVCRYFAPGWGIAEDPVTGSIHTWLVPFWARRLGKEALVSRQVSARGGTLYCRDLGDRTEIAGDAVLVLKGDMTL